MFSPFAHRNLAAERRGRGVDDQRVSSAFASSPEARNLLKATLRRNFSPELKTNILLDKNNVIQFAAIFNRELKVITNPTFGVDATGNPIVVAALSDRLGEATPIEIPGPFFKSMFVSFSEQRVREEFELPFSPQAPDEISGRDGEQPSMERHAFGPVDDQEQMPNFVKWPVFVYVLPGLSVPFGHPIDQPLPAPLGDRALDEWYKAACYVLNHNEGFSLTKGGPMFNLAEFSDEHDTILGPDVSLNINPPFQMCIAGAPTFQRVTTTFDALSNNIWTQRGAQVTPEDDQTPAGGATPDTPQIRPRNLETTISDAIDRMATTMRDAQSAPTAAEREQRDMALTGAIKLKIIFGNITTHPDTGRKRFALADFTDVGDDLLTKQRVRSASHKKWREVSFASVKDARAGDTWKDTSVTFEEAQANPALFDVFANAHFCVDITPAGVKTGHSVFNFLTPVHGSAAFKFLENEGYQVLQIFMNCNGKDAASKTANSTLSIAGALSAGEHVVEMLCNHRNNIKTFLQHDESLVGHYLMEYASHLVSFEGKRWARKFGGIKEVIISLACGAARMFGVFAEVGGDPDLIRAAQAGNALDTRVFDGPVRVAETVIANLQVAIDLDQPMDFRHREPIYEVYYPSTNNNGNQSRRPDNVNCRTNNNHNADAPPHRRPRNERNRDHNNDSQNRSAPGRGNRLPNDQSAAKERGVLVCTRIDGPLPQCPVRAKPNRDSRYEELLCMHYVTRGRACTRGRECKRVHLNSLDKLPAPKQQEFIAFVQSENDLSFADGCGPAVYIGPVLTSRVVPTHRTNYSDRAVDPLLRTFKDLAISVSPKVVNKGDDLIIYDDSDDSVVSISSDSSEEFELVDDDDGLHNFPCNPSNKQTPHDFVLPAFASDAQHTLSPKKPTKDDFTDLPALSPRERPTSRTKKVTHIAAPTERNTSIASTTNNPPKTKRRALFDINDNGKSFQPPLPSATPCHKSTPATMIDDSLRPTHVALTKEDREIWLSQQPKRWQTLVSQPFGKENLDQCFKSEAALRHVLLPLWKSGFLDESDWDSLQQSSPYARTLTQLLQECRDVKITGIRGFRTDDFESDTELHQERFRSVSKALLHFDGDAAALVRHMGGSHVGAHRDIATTLSNIKHKLDPELCEDYKRILTTGCPRHCNASATEANYQAFRKHGNHSTVHEEPTKTFKALVKDSKRGHVIPFDERIIDFLLNCHVTPQGMVDLDNPYKKPRPIFDSSFRPLPWCMAINDWTNKCTEKEVRCAHAEVAFFEWLWNLRISHPNQEIYIGDDDVSGAFRWLKYNPNLVAMHASIQAGCGVLNTGGTFGDNTAPSNWDCYAESRQQVARWNWLNVHDVTQRAAPYLPPLTFQPTPADVVFAKAVKDDVNRGVLNDDGSRIPPPYPHHVDDCPHADIGAFMRRTVSASVVSLYEVVGFPTPIIPNPLSNEKFHSTYDYEREILGRKLNTRTMELQMQPKKLQQLIPRLQEFLSLPKHTLTQAAEIHGVVENHTRHASWARPWFYALQNAMRLQYKKLFHAIKRRFNKTQRSRMPQAQLPHHLWKRIDGLMSKDQATLLWRNKSSIKMTKYVRAQLQFLLNCLTTEDTPFSVNIAQIVKRSSNLRSIGDACQLASGAHNHHLRYWSQVIWPEYISKGTKLPSSHPEFVHINALEMIVVILQTAAGVERLRTLTNEQALEFYPDGVPLHPVFGIKSDNTPTTGWAFKVTTKSLQGQGILAVHSELVRACGISVNCSHIAGELNDLADFLSRPKVPSASLAVRAQQVILHKPSMLTWDFFVPDPALLQLLFSRLFTPFKVDLPKLPKPLGRFAPTKSII